MTPRSSPPPHSLKVNQDAGSRVQNTSIGNEPVVPKYPGSEPMPKRAKKQDRPAMNDTKDNPSNDEDRKPAAKKTTPTPDGAPSTSCPGLQRKRARVPVRVPGPWSLRVHSKSSLSLLSRSSLLLYPPHAVPATRSTQKIKVEPALKTEAATDDVLPPAVPAMSGQEIKREPTLYTETAPAPATDQAEAEASIPIETVINAPNLNRTFAVRRKGAKRTEPWYLEPPLQQSIAAPLSPPPPQAEEIPARKKAHIKEPLVSLRRSTRLVDTTSNTGTLVPPAIVTVRASTLHRSSRLVIPTSNTATLVPPPTATVSASTLRRRTRQTHTQLLPIEMSEAQLADDADDGADLSGSSWEVRLSELADYRKIHGHCNVPENYTKTLPMTTFRFQELKSLAFE
jgi:hypothetical protein